MSSLNFPTNPYPNELYTIGTKTYIWNGVGWAIYSTAAVNSLLTVTNTLQVSSTASSTSTTTGALIITGGVGIGGTTYAGNIYSNGVLVGTSATYATNIYGGNTGSLVIQSSKDTTTFVPIGSAGSVLYTNDGTTATWVLASSIASNTATNASNVYVQQTSEDRNAGGIFYPTMVSTYDTDTPVDATSVFTWNDTTNRLSSPNITVSSSTTATSVSSGALIVVGGVGIRGDLYVGGKLYIAGAPALTTATLSTTIAGGTDIALFTSNSGTITINDTATLQSVTNRGNTTTNIVNFTNTSDSVSTTTGAVVITGGLGVGGGINSQNLQIAHAIMDSTQTTVNNTATIVVDTYSITQFRSAKYLIQIDDGDSVSRPSSANFEVIELLLLVDNSANVYATEYAVLTSAGGELGDFAADCDISGNIKLYFTAYSASNKVLRVFRTALQV